MVCPPALEIIHEVKLIDYLFAQADKPWYNYYYLVAWGGGRRVYVWGEGVKIDFLRLLFLRDL